MSLSPRRLSFDGSAPQTLLSAVREAEVEGSEEEHDASICGQSRPEVISEEDDVGDDHAQFYRRALRGVGRSRMI
jgi:hypothetical protein